MHATSARNAIAAAILTVTGTSGALAQTPQSEPTQPAASPSPVGTPQAAAEPAPTEGEIIVTARREAESLKDVPLSVSAFSAQAISEAGITRPNNFLQLLPNVNFINTAEAGDTQVIIRGVLNTRDVDPSFALIVDGVQQPNPNALNRELVDLEQIEVVKGPVSALYGRNALAGAIIISTKRPTNDFEGRVIGALGNGGLKRATGNVSGPIIRDKLFASASIAYRDFNGLYDNKFLGGKVDYYKEVRERLRLLFTPTDNFTLDLVGEHAKINGSALNFTLQVPGRPDVQPQFANSINVNDTSLPFAPNVRSSNPASRTDFSAKADYDFGPAVLTGIFGYNRTRNRFGGDFIVNFSDPALVPEQPDPYGLLGYTSAPGSLAIQSRDEDDYSYELRLSSHGDGPFQWQVGAFHGTIDRTVYVELDLDTMNGALPEQSPGPQTALINEWLRTKTKIDSAYAQLSYDITPTLEIAAAARYDEQRQLSINLNSVFVPLFNPFPSLERRVKYNRLQPRASLRWKPTDTLTLYGSYGEGFRAGGFNAPGTRALVLAVDQLPTTTNIQDAYKPEVLKGYEAGFKASLIDRRLFFGGAVFLNNARNTQLFEFTPVTSTRARLNVDRTRTLGFEAESTFKFNDQLSLNASYGYTKATVRRLNANPVTVGNRLLGVPKDTINLGASYDQPLAGDDLRFNLRADYQRIGETPWDNANSPGSVRKGINLVNIRAGLRGEQWSLTAYSENLFNKRYNVENIVSSNLVLGIVNFAAPGLKRTFGVEAEYRF